MSSSAQVENLAGTCYNNVYNTKHESYILMDGEDTMLEPVT